jgi:hypothetical protein
MPVPDEIDVYYRDQQPPIKCCSITELDAVLDKLHREADPTTHPLAVAIQLFGHQITMGLGTNPTFLVVAMAPCDGEYYVAVGDQTEGETLMFYGAGQDSYWPPKNMIPLDAARSAARYFVEHQKRSPSLRWQDWSDRDV